jgi:hypothetical protein
MNKHKRTLACWGRSVVQLAVMAVLGYAAANAWAQSRFSVSADGTEVTDTRTGLIWRRCSAGQSYSGGTCSGTASTYNHEAALAYAKSQAGWRLPNVKELFSIVDTDRLLSPGSSGIDPLVFPGTGPVYWSSSPASFPGLPAHAWHVYSDGVTDAFGLDRSSSLHVRLVR